MDQTAAQGQRLVRLPGLGRGEKGPADDGRQPKRQLSGQEGLGQVIVRPEPQAQQAVVVLIPGGEKEDGDVRLGPELLEEGKAVSVRQHDVQDDEIRDLRPEGLPGLLAAGGGPQELPALLFQDGEQQGEKLLVVVYD